MRLQSRCQRGLQPTPTVGKLFLANGTRDSPSQRTSPLVCLVVLTIWQLTPPRTRDPREGKDGCQSVGNAPPQ